MNDFLSDVQARKGRWRDATAEDRGVYSATYWMGQGRDPLEVAFATAAERPTVGSVRHVWKQRHGRAAAPLLLVVAYPRSDPRHAVVCGPAGEEPPVHDLDLAQAERLALTALNEPNRHLAGRFLASAFDTGPDELPGLRNKGLLATHELIVGVPQDPRWPTALERSQPLLGERDHDLIRGLGYTIETHGHHQVLRAAGDEHARAIAVFLQPTEQADQPSARFNHQTPVTYALTQAERDGLQWVVAVRGGGLRLYSTTTSGAAGQRGRADTYVELNLPLLPTEQAGYLHLLFSADALAPSGTIHDIQHASAVYTSRLSERLRDRVYDEVVPRLAVAVARQVGGTTEADLDHHYRTALTVLFRLLFVCYAEDNQLLPLHVNGEYTDHALKTAARRLAERINAGQDLGFDNPLTPEVEPATDTTHDDLWERCQALFRAVNEGHPRWGVPVYNGGLFTNDPAVSPAGPVIEHLTLANAEFGPALTALIVDRSPDGVVGPIDFRSLSVREFGTIYEGLLESELSLADQDLTLTRDGTYVPAGDGDDVVVEAGGVYLHNRSGARKSSGSYFTKPFAVEHLIDQAVDSTLDEHLARVAALLADGKEADATDALLDFRVADIAMGSAHFLTAVVDRLEARYTRFLTEHPIPQVTSQLDRLRNAAHASLGDLADTVEIENSSLLRRLIARRCIYGVDLNPIAVELARVAMWIHTFVPGLPLSFLDHNLVVGDSLTGIATIDEATSELVAEGIQGSLFDDPVRDTLETAQEPLRRLANLTDATPDDIVKARNATEELRQAVEPVARLLDLIVAARLGEADPVGLTSLDDVEHLLSAHARGVVAATSALHFPIAFPEVFLRDRPGFDVTVGNPPWEKPQVETHEFWGRHFPGFRSMKLQEQTAAAGLYEQQRPDLVAALEEEQRAAERLRKIVVSGPYQLGVGHTDLARIFAWRFWSLIRDGGRVGVVIPRSVALASPGMGSWRHDVLDHGSFEDVCLLVNNRQWIFDEVHPQYSIALLSLMRGTGDKDHIALQGPYRSLDDFTAGRRAGPATIPIDEFRRWSDTAAFPLLPDTASVHVYRTLKRNPAFGRHPSFSFRPIQGDVNATAAKKAGFYVDPAGSTDVWPVYSGASFNLWTPETGEVYAWTKKDVICRHLFDKRKSQANHSRSAFHGLPAAVLNDPRTLPCLAPRIAFRDVARATDSRTMISVLVPPGVVLQHSAPYLLGHGGTAQDEAFLLGVLSSIPLDWYARREVENHVTFTVLNAFPIPAPSPEHPGYERVAECAGRLAAVDDRYGEWAQQVGVPVGSVTAPDERADLIAAIDACVGRLYGLTEAHLTHVFETFHHGWDYAPRLAAVLEHYRRIEWTAPAESAA